jgi:EAL domain-containing protein (putative c-di-GMP-specific phosphodiesterase class I)
MELCISSVIELTQAQGIKDKLSLVCQTLWKDMALSDLALLRSSGTENVPSSSVPEMVHMLRKHLGMDIAFLTEFFNGNQEVKLVDTDEEDSPVKPGVCASIEETYCKFIIEGKLPPIMHDAVNYPLAAALPITTALGVRAYVSVPVYLKDGTVYGALCCYSRIPNTSLNERDLSIMKACAEMTGKQIDQQRLLTEKQRQAQDRIHSALSPGVLWMMYQPICNLRNVQIVGFEALSRFRLVPETRPDLLFNQAHEAGMGSMLEVRAIELGLEGLQHFRPDIYVAVNISADTILDPMFASTFDHLPLERVTLEITEHAAVERYQQVQTALEPLRKRGMQLAVDDAGAGFSSFRHILELAPDRIKLDCSLTRNVCGDPARRALVAAFVRFAQDTGTRLIAEGVETETELHALQELGVEKAQGYYLGRPMPLQQAINAVRPM